jgi:hypothetical protein
LLRRKSKLEPDALDYRILLDLTLAAVALSLTPIVMLMLKIRKS